MTPIDSLQTAKRYRIRIQTVFGDYDCHGRFLRMEAWERRGSLWLEFSLTHIGERELPRRERYWIRAWDVLEIEETERVR